MILQNGRPVYSRGVGVREVGSAALNGRNDMFRLASMTKAVTSVATIILVDQGEIGLVIRSSVSFLNSRRRGGAGPTV